MKYFVLMCTLLLAVSGTVHCAENTAPTSIKDTIIQTITASYNDGSLAFGAVILLAASLLIHSRFVKPPLVTPELYPHLFAKEEMYDDEPVVEKEKPQEEEPIEVRPIVPEEKSPESSLEQYSNSEIAHWASVNSNFEQPW